VRTKIPVAWAALAATAFGHFTWVAPSGELAAGKPIKIMVAHGDRFPHGDEAINAAQVKLWMLSSSGVKTDLKPVATKTAVLADFTPTQTGPHRIVFTQDRGVMSRTPKGVKPGGRDQNPGATESFALLRSGLHYLGSNTAALPALGLDLELTAHADKGNWNLQLLRGGKPVAGETVKVLLNNQEEGAAVGKTDANGKLVFKPAAGYKGPVLFLAEVKEKLTGAIDYRTISTSTFVTCI
jgi:uncharacterized GH25 family protein